MEDVTQYGHRLSGEEFQKRIVNLHKDLPPVPTAEQQLKVDQQELNLNIDYRLGCDFPAEKRKALWAVQQRVRKRPFRLILPYLLRKLFRKTFIKSFQGLAGFVIDEYAKVLNEKELERYFGKDTKSPALPMDENTLFHSKKNQ